MSELLFMLAFTAAVGIPITYLIGGGLYDYAAIYGMTAAWIIFAFALSWICS